MELNTLVGLVFFGFVIYVVFYFVSKGVRNYRSHTRFERDLSAAVDMHSQQDQQRLESEVDHLQATSKCTDEEVDEAKQEWADTETEAFRIRVMRDFDALGAAGQTDRIERAEFLAQAVSDGVLLDTNSLAMAEVVWWRVMVLTLTKRELAEFQESLD